MMVVPAIPVFLLLIQANTWFMLGPFTSDYGEVFDKGKL